MGVQLQNYEGVPKSTTHDDILACIRNERWYGRKLLILIAGASGDLAKKKTFPALFELWNSGLLPRQTTIYGYARTKKDDAAFRSFLYQTLLDDSSVKHQNRERIREFLATCFYGSVASYEDWEHLLNVYRIHTHHNLLVYMASPPHVFRTALLAVKKSLAELGQRSSGFTRVILEKPFGHDLNSCHELLKALQLQGWNENDMFRIDHYLGKEMIQNIPTLRSANAWLRRLWKRDVIESVHLVWKENVGTEGRGGYFDSYGIIRDVIQNHLMQMLSLVAMKIPTDGLSSNVIREAKVSVLKSIPPIIFEDCLLGQYRGYRNDPSVVNKETNTPTYAAIRCWVEMDAWKGVPFILEAGKALDENICEVRLNLRGNSHSVLVIRVQPTPTVFLTTIVKTPGFSNTPVTRRFVLAYNEGDVPYLPGAYSRLLLDALRGQQTNFVRDDELLCSWKIFSPLLHQIQREHHVPVSYDTESDGPYNRQSFLASISVNPVRAPRASL
jgi:glucose-6-phosphate 1-dehydrogenase